MRTIQETNSLSFIETQDDDMEMLIENDHHPDTLLKNAIARNNFV